MSDIDIKKEIKELDDIVMKMDELSDLEIAMSCPDDCPDPDRLKVPFCCIAKLPKGFKLDKNDADFKKWLVYDVSCLHCCLEPCKIPVTIHCCDNNDEETFIPGFSVKIVGCIKYTVGAFPVESSSGTPLCGGQYDSSGNIVAGTEGKGVICCQGCVCVDKVIGCISCDGGCNSTPTCNCECPDIDCTTVEVKNFRICSIFPCNKDQVCVKFTGKFKLPGCKPETP